jgi:F-type H+-transporting ATPase subunit delta
MSTLSNNTIAQAIYLASKDKTPLAQQSILRQVVGFLSRRRLFSKTFAILLELEKIINKVESRITVKVYSASKLEEETKISLIHSLKHRYSSKEVVLKEILNEKLLGGVRLEIDDEVMDLTLRNRMNKLQAHLTK